MRKELSRFSKMMTQHMAPTPSPGPKRRKQRTHKNDDTFLADVLPGVDLDVDMEQSSDTELTNTHNEGSFDNGSASDLDFIGPIELDDTFQQQEEDTHGGSNVAVSKESLPSRDQRLSDDATAAASIPIPTSPVRTPSPSSQTKMSPILTQLPSLRRSKHTIHNYFQPAPLDPRNTNPTDPAGATDK